MRIGIDIDGVLFPWTEVANESLEAKFGVPNLGPHLHWTWLKEQVTPEQWDWLWTEEGAAFSFSRTERVYPDVVEAFNSILRDSDHKCHFVTHRDPRRSAGHTAAFLARHFGRHPWAGLHVLQNGTPKCGLMEWDVFIDDKPETVYEMLDHTSAQVFAPARPWNAELAGHNGAGWTGKPRLVRYDSPWEVAEWVASQ